MNVVVRKPMTLDEFLAWEECQELRYEFDGFRPVAMTGGTFAHSSIQRNLIVELSNRLRGKPCQPHGSHLKIEVAGRIRYRGVHAWPASFYCRDRPGCRVRNPE